MQRADTQKTLADLLAWHVAMGADDLVAEHPTDWLARGDRPPGADLAPVASAPPLAPSDPPPRVVEPPAPRIAARQFSTASPDEATMAARALAREAASMADLEVLLTRFDGCGLKATAKSLCLFRGSAKARLMLIGEAPGRDEDIAGRPFVGPAGQLLDKMLAAIGLGEGDVHITNIVYWRPPGNRTPTPQEAQVCRPFLDRQIELVGPDIIVTLGGPATKQICNVADGIMKVRGKWHSLSREDGALRVLPTLHPAYLLRTPAAKRQAWRDMLTIEAALAR